MAQVTGPVCPIRVVMLPPGFSVSHMHIVSSREPVIILLPSGENPRQTADSVCPLKGLEITFPVTASHNRTTRSLAPEANRVPSGEKVTHTSPPVCIFRGPNTVIPVWASQIRMVRSSEPEIMRFPSAEKATQTTWSVCPFNSKLGGVNVCDRFSCLRIGMTGAGRATDEGSSKWERMSHTALAVGLLAGFFTQQFSVSSQTPSDSCGASSWSGRSGLRSCCTTSSTKLAELTWPSGISSPKI